MLNWFSQVSLFELFALVSGLAAVILLIRQNLWTWPVGVLYAGVSVSVFYGDGLYGQLLLHVFYVGMNLYGWWYWTRGGRASQVGLTDATDNSKSVPEELPVVRLNQSGLLLAVLIGALGTVGVSFALRAIGDSAFAWPDALVTSFSFVAMYLQARKYLETWAFWFFINIAAVGLYVSTGLYFYAVLYVVYLGLAVAGYLEWRKSLNNNT